MYKLMSLALVVVFLQPIQALYSADFVAPFFLEDGQYKTLKSSPEFPYMVEIELYGSHLCGGALIQTDVVITAGHCITSRDHTGLLVRAGHIYRGSENAPGLKKRKVLRVVRHPKFFDKIINGNTEVYFDVALMKLKKPFVVSEFINVLKLAPHGSEKPFENQVGTVLGWGDTEEGKLASALKKVQLTVLPQEECQKAVGEADYMRSLLCAKGKKNKGGFGGGDSGGPFVKHFPANPQADILLGVVSFSYDIRHPLNPKRHVPNEKRPSIFSNIAVFRAFIQTVLNAFEKLGDKQ